MIDDNLFCFWIKSGRRRRQTFVPFLSCNFDRFSVCVHQMIFWSNWLQWKMNTFATQTFILCVFFPIVAVNFRTFPRLSFYNKKNNSNFSQAKMFRKFFSFNFLYHWISIDADAHIFLAHLFAAEILAILINLLIWIWANVYEKKLSREQKNAHAKVWVKLSSFEYFQRISSSFFFHRHFSSF